MLRAPPDGTGSLVPARPEIRDPHVQAVCSGRGGWYLTVTPAMFPQLPGGGYTSPSSSGRSAATATRLPPSQYLLAIGTIRVDVVRNLHLWSFYRNVARSGLRLWTLKEREPLEEIGMAMIRFPLPPTR